MIRSLRQRLTSLAEEYPSQFWLLIGASFIDVIGSAMLFPFFTLYLTARFDVGLTVVGTIFAVFSVSSVAGSTLGGALTDRFGRKGVVLFGLAASAITSLLMGVASSITMFMGVAAVVGLFANAGGPARQTMIADLLPEEQRAQGFGIFRVSHNLAVVIGPVIGGLLATRSYMLLFVADAITSVIMAAIVAARLRETMPKKDADEPQETILDTFRGYGTVARDSKYMVFLVATGLMVLVYHQMNGTLAVFLRDLHGIDERGFGYILSLNAAMVVLFQFAITRRVENIPPYRVLAVGTALYAIGFGMYGFIGSYALFLVAMAIITIGEMLTAPVGQALAAKMAPEAMRGRYLAAYGFSWILPSASGTMLAGLIIDNADPRLLWYVAGLVAVAPAAVFWWLGEREAAPEVDEAESAGTPAVAAADELNP